MPDTTTLRLRRRVSGRLKRLIGRYRQRGRRLVALSDVEQDLIGAEAGWHQIAIMAYPNADAFIDMLRDPDYVAALIHRHAGLAETVVLVCRPLCPAAAGGTGNASSRAGRKRV